MSREPVRERRLKLGGAAVLSLEEAAEYVPISDAAAKAWLIDHGLVLDLDGRRVVIWGDVLDALRRREQAEPQSASPAPRRKRRGSTALPREDLG